MTTCSNAQSPQDDLEQVLRELSAPDPTVPAVLWRAALDSVHPTPVVHVAKAPLVTTRRRLPLSAHVRVHAWKLAVAGIAACLAIAVLVSVSTNVDSRPAFSVPMTQMGALPREIADQSFRDVPQTDLNAVLAQGKGGSGVSPFVETLDVPMAATPATSPGVLGGSTRLITRKARIEITVVDVATAFRRIGAEIESHSDDFIESSAFGGGDSATSATVVLRIVPDRLPAVLEHLRSLGTVTAETSSGEDVTDQVVDLDARILNERCVEMELLDLLDHRSNAALREILDLRDELSKVRGGIERLVAQRDRLSRLVALARIEVSLSLPAKVEERTIFGGLASTLHSGTRDATRSLCESAIGLWTGIIRNALPLAAIIVLAIATRAMWKRRPRPIGSEPAPRFA